MGEAKSPDGNVGHDSPENRLAESHAHGLWRNLMAVWGVVPACQFLIMFFFAKEDETLHPIVIGAILGCCVSSIAMAVFYERGYYTPQTGLMLNSPAGVVVLIALQVCTGGMKSPYMVAPLFHTMITCFASKDGLAFMLALAYATEVLLVGYLSASGLLPDCGISDETLLVWTLGFIVFQLVLSGWLSLWAERQTEFYISQLNLLYQTSKKASQAKGIFLATMSHELRTPLSHLLLGLDLLEAAKPNASDPSQKKPERRASETSIAGFPSPVSSVGSLTPQDGETGVDDYSARRAASCMSDSASVLAMAASEWGSTVRGARAPKSFLSADAAVTAGSSYSEQALKGGEKDCAEPAKLLRMMRLSAKHLLALISDVLDLEKMEAQKMASNPAPCDVSEIVRRAVEEFTVPTREKGIELHCAIEPPALPLVLLDRTHLKQIVNNVLSNAVKHTEQGGITVDVRLRDTDSPTPLLTISVTDTGPGIADHQIPLLFKQFSQLDADRTKRKYGGTGLGLAISKQLAELMQGDLSVESTVGVGSTFTLAIPAVLCDTESEEAMAREGISGESSERVEEASLPADSEAASSSQADMTADGESRSGSKPGRRSSAEGSALRRRLLPAREMVTKPLEGLRILLIDDNELNGILAAKLLDRQGAKVRTLLGGREAIDTLCAEGGASNFDVCLLDLCMPEVDGFEVLQRVREHEAQTGARQMRIIALTAMSLADDLDRAMALGANDYCTKPFDTHVLVSKLRQVAA